MSLPYPDRPDAEVGVSVGDALGRHYTPQRLADVMVDAIALNTGLEPKTVLEPSVGGGAFARAVRRRWPQAHIVGVDIDRRAYGFRFVDEVVVGDLPTLARGWVADGRTFDLVVGNPPFDEAQEHVRSLLELRPDVLSLILPWAYWGVGEWRPLLYANGTRPSWVRTIPGRPWPKNMRETADYEWWPRDQDITTHTRISALPEWE